ncbi:hypothetical protein C8F01DRAFT_1254690 [Mycena amicta]|nr:hypothetical protein C8F01DRAFT_1254690 [Mycena amicta]
MDLLRGEGHYIYGHVNNTRIERLWYDVTHGFRHKWKLFFVNLELNHGLMPTFAPHIWLIHHLFLNAINDNAQDWAEAWNRHQLGQRRQRTRQVSFIQIE